MSRTDLENTSHRKKLFSYSFLKLLKVHMQEIFSNLFIVSSEKALETKKNAFYHLSICFLVPEV